MHHTQPPFVRSLARSLARQCSLTAHHWGGKGRRRHRRRRKCAILNHHSFARSLIRSLANSCLTAHHWGGKGLHTGRHTQPPFVARSLARQIHCHTHHRSLARSPTHVSRSPLGRGRQHTAAIARSFARRLTARHWGMRLHKCTLTAHHWGGRGRRRRKRRHRRLHKCTILNHHSFARSLAGALSQFTIGQGGVTGAPRCAMVRSLADSPIHVPRPATEMRAETTSAPGARR